MRLMLLMLVLSFGAFANDHNDDQTPKCQRESCIVDGDSEYGFYIAEDIDGNKYYQINTETSLLDLPFDTMCFKGDITEATYIVSALAENTNKYYYQGGHSKVEGLRGKSKTDNSMTIEVSIFSDYSLESFKDDLNLKRCSN